MFAPHGPMDFRNLVILTGAGISQESGLSTFRDKDGIWSQVRIEDVATPEAFARDPEAVLAFYTLRRQAHRDPALRPNAAHQALARLERDWVARTGGSFLLVTQNVDSLHSQTGSRALLHMHGEMGKTRCQHCGSVHASLDDLFTSTVCHSCGRPGGLRPDVVWFGEMPYHMDRIAEALSACDLFVSIGTSGNVYPAAGFVRQARAAGAHTVELNLEPSEGASLFAEQHYGKASQIVPRYVADLCRKP
jgi:NAD-dependent deacetylase